MASAALIALAVVAVVVAPVVIVDRAGRRRTDAADTASAGQYWDDVQAAVATPLTDYERSIALGLMEDADAYADRIASIRAASQATPTKTRKEAA